LVAAALGIRRNEEERLQALASGYHVAVAVDAPGTLLQDYHTVQVAPQAARKAGPRITTRRNELRIPRSELNTVESWRDYLCDSLATVFLWAIQEPPPYTIDQIRESLHHPTFTLYLGRKSCPPALPLQPQLIEAENLHMAIRKAEFENLGVLDAIHRASHVRLFWEGDTNIGIDPEKTFRRRDQPTSRKRWQFADRDEHSTTIPLFREGS
jgi:CRISPR system Cascade subunit CasD